MILLLAHSLKELFISAGHESGVGVLHDMTNRMMRRGQRDVHDSKDVQIMTDFNAFQ